MVSWAGGRAAVVSSGPGRLTTTDKDSTWAVKAGADTTVPRGEGASLVAAGSPEGFPGKDGRQDSKELGPKGGCLEEC